VKCELTVLLSKWLMHLAGKSQFITNAEERENGNKNRYLDVEQRVPRNLETTPCSFPCQERDRNFTGEDT